MTSASKEEVVAVQLLVALQLVTVVAYVSHTALDYAVMHCSVTADWSIACQCSLVVTIAGEILIHVSSLCIAHWDVCRIHH